MNNYEQDLLNCLPNQEIYKIRHDEMEIKQLVEHVTSCTTCPSRLLRLPIIIIVVGYLNNYVTPMMYMSSNEYMHKKLCDNYYKSWHFTHDIVLFVRRTYYNNYGYISCYNDLWNDELNFNFEFLRADKELVKSYLNNNANRYVKVRQLPVNEYWNLDKVWYAWNLEEKKDADLINNILQVQTLVIHDTTTKPCDTFANIDMFQENKHMELYKDDRICIHVLEKRQNRTKRAVHAVTQKVLTNNNNDTSNKIEIQDL